MEIDRKIKEQTTINYDVNIRMIAFLVIVTVIILTSVYFIRIYTNQHARVLKDMQTEANQLEIVIANHLNYSKYFTKIVSRHVRNRIKDAGWRIDENDIAGVLRRYFQSSDFSLLLGLQKYSWINNQFFEVATSVNGILPVPQKLNFLKNIVESISKTDKDWYKNIVFYTRKSSQKGDSLKLISNITDNKENYIGSVMLSYDIATMAKSLAASKNTNINFVILDKNFNYITQSSNNINNIIDKNNELSPRLKIKIEQIRNDFLKNPLETFQEKNYSYLDMIHGTNYYIKPLKKLPFYIIVNINNNIIKRNILNSIAKKFVEVLTFSVIGLVSILSIYNRETSLRAKAEEATRAANDATKAKTNFLAFTAHEIRSPLGLIVTGSEIMKRQLLAKLPDIYVDYAEGIYKNAKIILDFITDILDENQIAQGKFKIVKAAANVKEIIDDVVQSNLTQYSDKNINIATEFGEKLPLLICDKRRISQAINNLVSNSVKYSENGSTIKVIAKMTKGLLLQVKVIDNGIGMNQNDIEAALDVYGKTYRHENRSIDSYGLGLSIVKMLLDAHNAHLAIKSKLKLGTTVIITFAKSDLIFNK